MPLVVVQSGMNRLTWICIYWYVLYKQPSIHSQVCWVGDPADDLSLAVWADADFAGDPRTQRSTSASAAAMVGPNTRFFLSALFPVPYTDGTCVGGCQSQWAMANPKQSGDLGSAHSPAKCDVSLRALHILRHEQGRLPGALSERQVCSLRLT